jgi:hypothetical protein
LEGKERRAKQSDGEVVETSYGGANHERHLSRRQFS